MLKNLPRNPEAEEVIDHLRRFIASDIGFVVAHVKPDALMRLKQRAKRYPLTVRVVAGSLGASGSFNGVILTAENTQTQHPPELPDEILELFSDRPFVFISRQCTQTLWPHETLEDRVIDASLFALADYDQPITLGFL